MAMDELLSTMFALEYDMERRRRELCVNDIDAAIKRCLEFFAASTACLEAHGPSGRNAERCQEMFRQLECDVEVALDGDVVER